VIFTLASYSSGILYCHKEKVAKESRGITTKQFNSNASEVLFLFGRAILIFYQVETCKESRPN
jgi:hypothetical protein